MQGMQQQAQLNLMNQQASALRVGKWSLGITAVSNFFKKGMEALVFVNDNQAKIISGAVVSFFLVPKIFSAIKEQLGFGQ